MKPPPKKILRAHTIFLSYSSFFWSTGTHSTAKDSNAMCYGTQTLRGLVGALKYSHCITSIFAKQKVS